MCLEPDSGPPAVSTYRGLLVRRFGGDSSDLPSPSSRIVATMHSGPYRVDGSGLGHSAQCLPGSGHSFERGSDHSICPFRRSTTGGGPHGLLFPVAVPSLPCGRFIRTLAGRSPSRERIVLRSPSQYTPPNWSTVYSHSTQVAGRPHRVLCPSRQTPSRDRLGIRRLSAGDAVCSPICMSGPSDIPRSQLGRAILTLVVGCDALSSPDTDGVIRAHRRRIGSHWLYSPRRWPRRLLGTAAGAELARLSIQLRLLRGTRSTSRSTRAAGGLDPDPRTGGRAVLPASIRPAYSSSDSPSQSIVQNLQLQKKKETAPVGNRCRFRERREGKWGGIPRGERGKGGT